MSSLKPLYPAIPQDQDIGYTGGAFPFIVVVACPTPLSVVPALVVATLNVGSATITTSDKHINFSFISMFILYTTVSLIVER